MQGWELPSEISNLKVYLDTISERESWKQTFYVSPLTLCPMSKCFPCILLLCCFGSIGSVYNARRAYICIYPAESSCLQTEKYVADGWKLKREKLLGNA